MFRKTALAVLAAGLSFAAAPVFAQSSPVAGNWATKVVVGEMTIDSTLSVAQAAGGYTVDIKDGPMPGAPAGPESQPAPSQISDVKVDGSKLTFKRHLTTPQGEMDLAYNLTANGNALSGTINSSFGDIPITGTRQ